MTTPSSATASDKAALAAKLRAWRDKNLINSHGNVKAAKESAFVELNDLIYAVEAKATPDESLKALEAAVEAEFKLQFKIMDNARSYSKGTWEEKRANLHRIEGYLQALNWGQEKVQKLITAATAQKEPKEMRA